MTSKESDTFRCHPGQLEIGPDGVAEDGTLCRWKGFNKITDKFWGTPKKQKPNMNQPNNPSVESSQK